MRKISPVNLYLFLIGTVLLLSILIYKEPLRDFSIKKSEQRKILSTLYFRYSEVLDYGFQVIKLKTSNSIYIEIYKIYPDNQFELISQINTDTIHDGFYLFPNKASNLFLTNVDSSAKEEILVPGFDKNLNAYLNVIKLNESTGFFELVENLKSSITE